MGYSLPLTIMVGFFYTHHPTDRVEHTAAYVTPVVEHWLEREIIVKEKTTTTYLFLNTIVFFNNSLLAYPSYNGKMFCFQLLQRKGQVYLVQFNRHDNA